MSLTVLLVEDDRELRSTLRSALEVEGYRVLPAASVADATALLNHATGREALDMVLLDLALPDGDGEDFLLERLLPLPMPVIVISAREAEAVKVRVLDAGADDYLTKPFSLAELLARMRVAWRHRGRRVQPAITRWTSGDLSIDLALRKVTRQGGQVHLTPTEFDLLARLVRDCGRVVTHRQLLTDVWGSTHAQHTHYLRLYMAQLRAKLEACPSEPAFLLTEPGVGYRLADADAEPGP